MALIPTAITRRIRSTFISPYVSLTVIFPMYNYMLDDQLELLLDFSTRNHLRIRHQLQRINENYYRNLDNTNYLYHMYIISLNINTNDVFFDICPLN